MGDNQAECVEIIKRNTHSALVRPLKGTKRHERCEPNHVILNGDDAFIYATKKTATWRHIANQIDKIEKENA